MQIGLYCNSTIFVEKLDNEPQIMKLKVIVIGNSNTSGLSQALVPLLPVYQLITQGHPVRLYY